jgi:5-methylcytosine-specific restriction protein B
MARFNGAHNAEAVYAAGAMFRERCLENDGSLLSSEAPIWSSDNLRKLKRYVFDDPDPGDDDFLTKLKKQLDGAEADVIRLAAEALCVYFLFPSKVGLVRKQQVVNTVLGWTGMRETATGPVLAAFAGGLGGTGQGYNTRRPYELGYLIELILAWKEKPARERQVLLDDAWQFREFAVMVEGDTSRQLRHILLHLLFPEKFERIGSARQKRQVLDEFGSLCEQDDANEDEQLLAIRQKLSVLLDKPAEALDFYADDLALVWGGDAQSDDDMARLLVHKRQIVLYGPPGTGKTHDAKRLARQVIHGEALKRFGARKYFETLGRVNVACEANIHRLQLHPAYSYEDFVRGLHIGPNGTTEYRPGSLLRLVETMGRQKDDELRLPHVLILDEMNRTDLSRMLGECFSLLENRNEPAELPGHWQDGSPMRLTIPRDLYIIGTMNLIDQSVEQIDFALRRRFLWVYHGFDAQAFLDAAQARWEAAEREDALDAERGRKRRYAWSALIDQFELLAEAALELNRQIGKSHELGPQYEIGHTYLLDVVDFLRDALTPKSRSLLWHATDGKPLEPVQQLWRLSLRPLLEQYLGGLGNESQRNELVRLERCFLGPRLASQ